MHIEWERSQHRAHTHIQRVHHCWQADVATWLLLQLNLNLWHVLFVVDVFLFCCCVYIPLYYFHSVAFRLGTVFFLIPFKSVCIYFKIRTDLVYIQMVFSLNSWARVRAESMVALVSFKCNIAAPFTYQWLEHCNWNWKIQSNGRTDIVDAICVVLCSVYLDFLSFCRWFLLPFENFYRHTTFLTLIHILYLILYKRNWSSLVRYARILCFVCAHTYIICIGVFDFLFRCGHVHMKLNQVNKRTLYIDIKPLNGFKNDEGF